MTLPFRRTSARAAPPPRPRRDFPAPASRSRAPPAPPAATPPPSSSPACPTSALPGGIASDAATARHPPLARLRARARYQPPNPCPPGTPPPPGPSPPSAGPPSASATPSLTMTHGGRSSPRCRAGTAARPRPSPRGILERTRIIGHVNWLAARDGWRFDCDRIWTCPACQQATSGRPGRDSWSCTGSMSPRPARLLPVHLPPGDEYRCTCPGAVLAVDVMLASEDHLGSGEGRHRAGAR